MVGVEAKQGQSIELRRPLSPHLSVYRPMLTMMMSIAHRITGAALYVGTSFSSGICLPPPSGGGAFASPPGSPAPSSAM